MGSRAWLEAGLISPKQADAIERLDPGRAGATAADLERWARIGILTTSQLASIRRLESSPAPTAAVAPIPARPVAAAAEPAPRFSVLNPRVVARPAAAGASPVMRGFLRPDVRFMGVALTVLAVLSVAGNLLGVMTDVFIAPWRLVGADFEDLAHVGGALLGITGGLMMYRGWVSGRAPAVAGLLINVVATLAYAGGRLADPLVYLALAVWGGLIALTLRSTAEVQ